MSMPKLLTTESTIVATWTDPNLTEEETVGYFVTKDEETEGVTIKKATMTSDVLGVTLGTASPTCSYVGILGIVPVRDNGECVANGKCLPSEEGIAIPKLSGYLVLDRIDSNHIRIMLKPSSSGGGSSGNITVSGSTLVIG